MLYRACSRCLGRFGEGFVTRNWDKSNGTVAYIVDSHTYFFVDPSKFQNLFRWKPAYECVDDQGMPA